MAAMNAFYAQSGGVTAVINASACGVIETARKHRNRIAQCVRRTQRHHRCSDRGPDRHQPRNRRGDCRAAHMPGGAFGSARYKLKGIEENRAEYERLIEVFRAHDIGYFFYNGGNDSMDTAHKVSQISQKHGIPGAGDRRAEDGRQRPAGDRQLPGLRVGREICRSVDPRGRDGRRIDGIDFDRVFILEVMGRHAGWIAAAGGLAGTGPGTRRTSSCSRRFRSTSTAFIARVRACVDELRLLRHRRQRGCGLRGRPLSRRSRDTGRLRACTARRRSAGDRGHGARRTGLQVSLRHCGLPAALGSPYRLRGRRPASLVRGCGSREVRTGGHERRDAGDQADLGFPLPLEDRGSAAREDRQQGEENSAALHYKRRLRHHPSLPEVPGTADPRGGLSSLYQGLAQVSRAEERSGTAKVTK